MTELPAIPDFSGAWRSLSGRNRTFAEAWALVLDDVERKLAEASLLPHASEERRLLAEGALQLVVRAESVCLPFIKSKRDLAAMSRRSAAHALKAIDLMREGQHAIAMEETRRVEPPEPES
jgi:hypothetical protein